MIAKRIIAFIAISAMLLAVPPFAQRGATRAEAAPTSSFYCKSGGIPLFALLNVSPDDLKTAWQKTKQSPTTIPSKPRSTMSIKDVFEVSQVAFYNLHECTTYKLQNDIGTKACQLVDSDGNILVEFDSDATIADYEEPTSAIITLAYPNCSSY